MNPLLKDVPKISYEEQLTLIERYRDGDNEAAGTVIHANGPWINRIIGKLNVDKNIHEELFCDVMPNVLTALKIFDPNKSSLKTFLYLVVSRAALRAAKQYESVMPLEGEPIDERPGSCSIIEDVWQLFSAISPDEVNEQGRQLIIRLVKGYSQEEIAEQFGWTDNEAKQIIADIRRYMAWVLMQNEFSAEPWMSNDEINKLANEHKSRMDSWL